MNTAINIPIQRGDKTHNQDHVIILANFRPIKSNNKRPTKLTPPEDLELLESLILSFVRM